MDTLLPLLICGLFAALMSYILIPLLKKMAIKVKLVDVPGKRKVHSSPIPLVGGIAVIVSSFIALLMSPWFLMIAKEYYGLMISSLVLFITGLLDDRFDLKAKHKLLIQMACAHTLASFGFRITSFYGVFGIYEINDYLQYLVTILVVTGTVNAFNLMDGIDGLAGGLSVLGFLLFLIIGLINQNYILITISASFIGALFVFLKNNLSDQKIFMGDSGSLVLGFILVAIGIHTIEHPGVISNIPHSTLLLSIIAFFAIPALDSLRVYRGRIKKGNSPFRADKTHLHHLFLSTGLKHKKISLTILILVGSLILFIFGYNRFLTLSVTLCIILLFYFVIAGILSMINDFKAWKEKIKEIERN